MKKMFSLILAVMMLFGCTVPVSAEDATYEKLYAEKLAYVQSLDEDVYDYGRVWVLLQPMVATEEPPLSKDDFDFSIDCTFSNIIHPTRDEIENGEVTTRGLVIFLKEYSPEGAAEIMARLEMHPLVQFTTPYLSDIGDALYGVEEEIELMIYEWATKGDRYIDPIEDFSFEDMLGEGAGPDYRIYHVRNLSWGFTQAICEHRIGNRVFYVNDGDFNYVVCQMKDGECVGVYRLDKAYEMGIIDDAALDKMQDPCGHSKVFDAADYNERMLYGELVYHYGYIGEYENFKPEVIARVDKSDADFTRIIEIIHFDSTETNPTFERVGDWVLHYESPHDVFVAVLYDGDERGRVWSLELAGKMQLSDEVIAGLNDSCGAITGKYRVGDLDQSGAIDVGDMMKMKDMIMNAGEDGEFTQEELAYGNLDGNKTITVGDLMRLKAVIMAS